MTKTNYDPLPKSEKLIALLSDLDKQKAKAKQSQAEVWRLTKARSPQIQDSTVIRTTDADAPTAAFIGIKKSRDQPGVVSTGMGEQEVAASNEDILRRTLAGESLADATDIKEQLAKEHRQWSAHESAIEHLTREIEKEKAALAMAYFKLIKPKHDEQMARLCKALLDVHTAWAGVYELKRHLIDSGAGLRGLCLTTPESFLSTPTNPHSELSEFLRAAKREGFIREIPAEVRL
jgi:hypothetical protein